MAGQVTVPLIAGVAAIGIICLALFFFMSRRYQLNTSAYLTPGFLGACLLSPIIAIAIGVIQFIKSFGQLRQANEDITYLMPTIIKNINKPLICSLVLALVLCGGATVYLKRKIGGAFLHSSIKKSKLPAILSMFALIASLVPFFIYHRAQRLMLYVLTQNKYFAGRSPASAASEIAAHLIYALLTSLFAIAAVIMLLVGCLILSIRVKNVLVESHILLMYCGLLAVMGEILAMTLWPMY